MYKIGVFSKLTQVSGSTLRYYDDIGLFKPEYIDAETGYRFYRATQIPELNRIVALKELGLNLDQISHVLEKKLSAEAFKGMLELKQAELQQKLQEDQARLRRIAVRLRQLDEKDLIPPTNMELKPLAALPYLSMRLIVGDFQEALFTINHMREIVQDNIPEKELGSFVAILMQECYEHKDIELKIGFLTHAWKESPLPSVNGKELCLETLPEIELALTCVHVGPPNETFISRSSLAAWAENNNYEFFGESREVFLSPISVNSLKESVIELQYPIRRINPSK